MKKILFEYINIFAYVIVGLVFGFSFFLLFLNFYHYKEVNTKVNISANAVDNREKTTEKLNKIKTNASLYQQSTYNGKNNIYDMNAIQIKLNSCVKIFESEEYNNLANKETVELKDVYKLGKFYQNKVLNDCIVMQINSLAEENSSFSIASLSAIRPFLKTNINQLLTSNGYITSILENADNYYFTNDISKSSIFFLAKDSYSAINKNYQNTLDFLVEISEWYKSEVVGG